jgi:hypothetical protein
MSLILNLLSERFYGNHFKEESVVVVLLRTFPLDKAVYIPAASKAVLQFSNVSVKRHHSLRF